MHDDENSACPVEVYQAPELGMHDDMENYRAAAIAYLRRVKDTSPLSLNEIAQRANVSHTTLTRPLNSETYKYVPKFSTLQRVAEITGVPLPSELTRERSAPSNSPLLEMLTVRGVVAAGMWQSSDFVQDEPLGLAPMGVSPRYAGLTQWAELVRGPSMNRVYQDGDYLHVVDAAELGFFPHAGSVVVVERRMGQDGNVERTVKRIVQPRPGRYELVGDSTVERWNQPLPMEGGDDCIIQVIGLVIGFYRPGK